MVATKEVVVSMRENPSPVGRTRGQSWALGEWFLGIFGGIAAFLGLFILLGDEGQYVGFGGDWSWRVGDIAAGWAYFLLIAGVVLLAGALAMVYAGRKMIPVASTPMSDLLLHAVVFVVVNAFIWIQDFAAGGGLDYAYWTTIPWGAGLAIHALAVLFRGPTPIPEKAPEKERELQYH
jgi:hypothetical protein